MCVVIACSSVLVLQSFIYILSESVDLLLCVGIITTHGNSILIILLICRSVYNVRR